MLEQYFQQYRKLAWNPVGVARSTGDEQLAVH